MKRSHPQALPNDIPPPPDATIDEAVAAFYRNECVHYCSPSGRTIWQLSRIEQRSCIVESYAFVCVNRPATQPLLARGTPHECLEEVIVRQQTQLYLAPSLSAVLNAYDL